MKTPTSVSYANSSESGDDRTILVAYSDGTSEIVTRSIIALKAGAFGQKRIDEATESKTLYESVESMCVAEIDTE